MKTEILTIIFAILTVAGVFVSYYFYVKAKVYAATEAAVNDAEQDDKLAEEKMKFAVSEIYAIVPAVFKPILTPQAIEKIVQKAFDKIEEYAQKQVEKERKNEKS